MGAVASFAKEVGRMALKGAISATVGAIPIVGSHAAEWINSNFARGGKMMKFADGGIVAKLEDKGFKTKEVNTPAQLIAAIKKFPEAASKAGLSVAMVKDAVAEHGAGNTMSKEAQPELQPEEPMVANSKRGGRRRHHHHEGHVEELSVPKEVHHKKRHHKKRHHERREEEAHYLQGGSVAALPWSNLDRLAVQAHAHGGLLRHHDTGLHIGLRQGDGEQSYIQLRHGR